MKVMIQIDIHQEEEFVRGGGNRLKFRPIRDLNP